MTENIRVGTMLLEDGTLIPKSMIVATESYSAGWSSIFQSSSAQLGKELESAGWTFFYLAGEIRTTGFGFDDRSRTDRAVSQLIDAVKRQHCNCLEITEIRRRSFLWLAYTSLVAHARHIQRSRSFHELSYGTPTIPFYPGDSISDKDTSVQSSPSSTGEPVQAWENEDGSGIEPIPYR
jgi:hypothetical protein